MIRHLWFAGLCCLLAPGSPALAGPGEAASVPPLAGEVIAEPLASGDPSVPAVPAEVAEPEGLCWLGQDFVRFRQGEEAGLRSEEYRLRTEEGTEWSQRVTVRQFHLAPRVSLAGFCGVLLKAVEAACPGSQVECLLKPGRRAVYVVGGGEKDPMQRTQVCLLLLEGGPGDLLVFQYSQRPGRLDQNLAELQLNAWRERFLAQARQASEGGEAGRDHE